MYSSRWKECRLHCDLKEDAEIVGVAGYLKSNIGERWLSKSGVTICSHQTYYCYITTMQKDRVTKMFPINKKFLSYSSSEVSGS